MKEELQLLMSCIPVHIARFLPILPVTDQLPVNIGICVLGMGLIACTSRTTLSTESAKRASDTVFVADKCCVLPAAYNSPALLRPCG